MITDDELAEHPDPRVDPGICGVVARSTVEGAPLQIERICVLPPHDSQTKSGNRGRDREGHYPRSERHYFVTRYPNRENGNTP
jgi:hypothetical protein